MSDIVYLLTSIIFKKQRLPDRSNQRYRYLQTLAEIDGSQLDSAKDVWHEHRGTHQLWALTSLLAILVAILASWYWMLSYPVNFQEATRVGVDVVVCGMPGLVGWHLTTHSPQSLQHYQFAELSFFFWVRLPLVLHALIS